MEQEIEKYFDRLWPICRSITGNGLRDSLNILRELVPLELHEVPSGTPVFDWHIPREWNIKDAYIITPDGRKIADFKSNNLHVLNYSIPVNKELSFEELSPHLFSLPDMPDAIPYLTSYYKETWGFCIRDKEKKALPTKGTYKAVIESSLTDGSLTYGDFLLEGDTEEEILFSTYLCHPSMANNELSGPLVTAYLYREVAALRNRRYTYRFVFVPETIGAIAYLSRNGSRMKEKTAAGYVVTCVGDHGEFTYKRSKAGNTLADRAAEHVLRSHKVKSRVIDFAIGGSDERQYCSPGFNLPVGSLMRTPYQQYSQYHTSLDDKSFISFAAMAESVGLYLEIVKTLELNRRYINTQPYGEPQLGKRGLYADLGGQRKRSDALTRRLHLLCFADGAHDLISIAEKMGLPATDFESTIAELTKAGLLKA